MTNLPVYAVIMAGGQGTRLWPISRAAKPKQFLDLTGSGQSLLQKCMHRALELTDLIGQVLVLTNQEQAGLVHEQLPELPDENILIEPVSRNTAPGLGLAAFHLANHLGVENSSKTIMAVLPVDHLFVDETPWLTAVRTAILAASQTQNLVGIGLEPRRPASNYGYQHLGKILDLGLTLPVHLLQGFVEKPAASLAIQLYKSGEWLWNTGTYAWKVSVFLAALKAHAPRLYTTMHAMGNPIDLDRLNKDYSRMENISVDHALLEKAANVLTVRANFERIDVGSFESLGEIWSADPEGNACLGDVLFQGSRDNLVYADEGLVVLVGVNDLIVVRAGDVCLICPKGKSQAIKEIVARIQKTDLGRYM